MKAQQPEMRARPLPKPYKSKKESAMKVSIENKSSAAITVKGRHTLRIPAEGALETVLPDNDQTSRTLARLRREYPALKISVEKGIAAPSACGNPGKADAAPMEKEAFAALANAAKGTGDKWNVSVEGVKTFKIKEAADEAGAIELAYAAYLEDFSAANAE